MTLDMFSRATKGYGKSTFSAELKQIPQERPESDSTAKAERRFMTSNCKFLKTSNKNKHVFCVFCFMATTHFVLF